MALLLRYVARATSHPAYATASADKPARGERTKMEVLLRQDVEALGHMGDVVAFADELYMFAYVLGGCSVEVDFEFDELVH